MSEFVSTHPLLSLSTEEHHNNNHDSSSSSSSTFKSSNSVELKASTTTNTTTNFFTTYPTRRPNTATPTRQAGSTSISNYSTFLTPTTILNSSTRQQTSTDALLFQSLRAGAQELNLEADSLGWAILRHLSLSSARPVRALIRRLISSPNPLILVLPQSKQSSPLTTETIHDHLLVTCTPESGTGLCSSLSGWRALIEGDRLMVYSPGRPFRFNADLVPNSLVSTVKPSTSLSSELTAPTRLRLPLFSFTSLTSTTLTLPGLPPSRTSTTTQRLASLFGPKPEDHQLSDPTDEPLSISIRVLADHGTELASASLDEALRDALRNRIRDSLGSLEESVLTKIGGFVDRLSRGGSGTGDRSLYLSQPQEVSEALQQLYRTIEADLEKEYSEEPVLVDHTLELVEEVICVELYDRLLTKEEDLSEMISDSNFVDISLDQLGLDLDRSEMDDPDRVAVIRTGLDEIIAAATSELARLQDLDCRSPRDKLSVCVRVHKLIVDALSVLPPIPLKRDTSIDPALTAVEMTTPVTACSTPRISSASLPTPSPLRPQDPSDASAADLLDALQTELFPSDPSPSSPSPPPTRPSSPLPPTVTSALKPRSSSASSADLILPMLIYLLIHSTQPQDILSHLKYVRRHRHKRFLSGETDYCLVNFEVALAFIRGSNEGPPLGIKKEDQGKRGEGLGVARRLVSDMLVGGYQRVVSAPRTLEDVRRILSTAGSSSEGGNGSNTRWGNIIREGTGRFFNKDELSAVSTSSKPGLLSSLRRSTLGSSEIEHTTLESAHTAGDAKQHQTLQDLAKEDGGGPIARFESCKGAEELVMGDITLLVKDYQRLARIGRRAGIWK